MPKPVNVQQLFNKIVSRPLTQVDGCVQVGGPPLEPTQCLQLSLSIMRIAEFKLDSILYTEEGSIGNLFLFVLVRNGSARVPMHRTVKGETTLFFQPIDAVPVKFIHCIPMVAPSFELSLQSVEDAYLVLHNCHFTEWLYSELPIVLLDGSNVGHVKGGPKLLSDGTSRVDGKLLPSNVPAELLSAIQSDYK